VPEVRYGKAINRALHDAMAMDPAVLVFGEDIAGAGGSFGVTRGLLETFGPQRVRDTPISEATILSAAVGAALSGLKPVVEIMFMDFITLGMDALVNQAAKARFMFGGQTSVPMVLRTPHGGGLAAGPQHSQCLEGWLAHVPGLKVVCPATVADAYGLMRAAIDDPDLVGPIIAASPAPCRQRDLAVALGRVLHRPTWLPVPAWLLKLVLGGQSTLLLDSRRVRPAGLDTLGFAFRYRDLEAALRDVLDRPD